MPVTVTPTVGVLADRAAVERATAEEFAIRREVAVRAHGAALVALSGGSPPRAGALVWLVDRAAAARLAEPVKR